MPWLTFAIMFAALYTRMIRATVIEVLHEDHVRTARAKGAEHVAMVRRRALKSVLLPVVSMLGLDFGLASEA